MAHPLGLSLDPVPQLDDLRVRGGGFQELGVAGDPGQGGVDFVDDSRRKQAEGGHLLLGDQLPLQVGFFRHVREEEDVGVVPAVEGEEGDLRQPLTALTVGQRDPSVRALPGGGWGGGGFDAQKRKEGLSNRFPARTGEKFSMYRFSGGPLGVVDHGNPHLNAFEMLSLNSLKS